jgi:hypothetical protein
MTVPAIVMIRIVSRPDKTQSQLWQEWNDLPVEKDFKKARKIIRMVPDSWPCHRVITMCGYYNNVPVLEELLNRQCFREPTRYSAALTVITWMAFRGTDCVDVSRCMLRHYPEIRETIRIEARNAMLSPETLKRIDVLLDDLMFVEAR